MDLRVDWGFSHPQLPLAPQSGGRKVTDYVKSSLCGSGFSSWVVSFHQSQMAPAPKRTVLLHVNLILCQGKKEVRKESKKGRKEKKEGGKGGKKEKEGMKERVGERREGGKRERRKEGKKEEREKERKAISISSTHLSGESVHFMRVHYLFFTFTKCDKL